MSPQPAFMAMTFDDASHDAAVPPQMQEAMALVERIGGRELIEGVSFLFRTTSNERIEKLHDALAAGDTTRIARIAHAMKGSSAQVGAESLRLIAVSLETEAASLDAAALARHVERVGREVHVAWAQLDRYHSSRGHAC